MRVYNNLIIGAGASGLMVASNLKDKQNSIILEQNPKVGAKILVSGGGRCNFTNKIVTPNHYLAKKESIKPLLNRYSSKKILNYFKNRGLEYTIKDNTQYFCKNSSKDILELLLKDSKEVEIALNSKVLSVKKESTIFKVETNNKIYFSKNLIVASGGLSFPQLGTSSIGFDIAKSFNHTITPPAPALVGFTLQPSEAFFKSLSGVSVDVIVEVEKRELKGSLLFAHRGISGPIILNTSLFWSRGLITINFLPEFNLESIRDSKKNISTILPLPKRVSKAFLEKFNIEDKKCSLLTKDEFNKLKQLQEYKFAPAGTFGYSKAEVTKGGVDITEINLNSFESKLEKNLYFLGEVLDVTGMLGGYNFHFAFASALSCAKNLNNN